MNRQKVLLLVVELGQRGDRECLMVKSIHEKQCVPSGMKLRNSDVFPSGILQYYSSSLMYVLY